MFKNLQTSGYEQLRYLQQRLTGRSRLQSLEEVVATDEGGGKIVPPHEVLSADQEDPSIEAARRLDWEAL